MDKTFDALKAHKETIVTYLNMLNSLKSKINFGKDDYSLKIEFAWKDTLKNDFFCSYNVNLEYYSVLFNLGICYNLIANQVDPQTDEEAKIKEAIKYYQYSAWIFDKVKNEIPTFIPVKEVQPDMSQNYLTYVRIYKFNISALI